MIELLLIADDFTGALDTGVQFARRGVVTRIITGSEHRDEAIQFEDTEVLVVDSDSRHRSAEEAYNMIYDWVSWGLDHGISHIFKKTDSALRGNIGSELSAMLDASGEDFLGFIPALPNMHRTTIKGIHYLEGVPIHETVFGKDPFEPIKSSYVKDLFDDQSVDVMVIERNKPIPDSYIAPTIGIFDVVENQDIQIILDKLDALGRKRILAGCAGLGEAWAIQMGKNIENGHKTHLPRPIIIISGSLNPITKKQIRFATENGIPNVSIEDSMLSHRDYLDTEEGKVWVDNLRVKLNRYKALIIDTREARIPSSKQGLYDQRESVSDFMGKLANRFVTVYGCDSLMIIGGDTLKGFVKEAECEEILLVEEVQIGTVLSTMTIGDNKVWVVSKSGGFGKENLILEIINESLTVG